MALRASLSRAGLVSGEHGRQVTEFGFHFGGIGYRIRNFLAKELAIPLAKPMNSHFERPLRGLHFASQRGIRRVGLPEKEDLQALKMLWPPVLHEFIAQFFHDSVEHRK